jgi:hypothetical protein
VLENSLAYQIQKAPGSRPLMFILTVRSGGIATYRHQLMEAAYTPVSLRSGSAMAVSETRGPARGPNPESPTGLGYV